jgi:PmbA protein
VASDNVDYCLEQLAARGFDHGEVRATLSEKDELQAEFNVPSMLRTVRNQTLELAGIVNHKKAELTLNKTDPQSVQDAVAQLWDCASAAPADAANAIAEAQPHQVFTGPALSPDLNTMCDRLDEFLDHTKSSYPSVTLGMAGVSHLRTRQRYANSNGVVFDSQRGHYQAQAMFTAKEDHDVSSFSYSGVSTYALDKPIAACASFDRLMANSAAQVRTRKIPQKFTGDLIITPDCVGSFIGFLLGSLSGGPMISGTSIYKEGLDTQVGAEMLTIRSLPLDMPAGYFVTGDGYPARNVTVVERGYLRSYLLDLYAARKTGLDRAQTAGGCYAVDAGTQPLAQMLASVERGLLVSRFSGGKPSDKGDFSGVAKNSFYVESGALAYPISETMISGNLADLLMNITAVSIETIDFGSSHYPWIKVSGIGIS